MENFYLVDGVLSKLHASISSILVDNKVKDTEENANKANDTEEDANKEKVNKLQEQLVFDMIEKVVLGNDINTVQVAEMKDFLNKEIDKTKGELEIDDYINIFKDMLYKDKCLDSHIKGLFEYAIIEGKVPEDSTMRNRETGKYKFPNYELHDTNKNGSWQNYSPNVKYINIIDNDELVSLKKDFIKEITDNFLSLFYVERKSIHIASEVKRELCVSTLERIFDELKIAEKDNANGKNGENQSEKFAITKARLCNNRKRIDENTYLSNLLGIKGSTTIKKGVSNSIPFCLNIAVCNLIFSITKSPIQNFVSPSFKEDKYSQLNKKFLDMLYSKIVFLDDAKNTTFCKRIDNVNVKKIAAIYLNDIIEQKMEFYIIERIYGISFINKEHNFLTEFSAKNSVNKEEVDYKNLLTHISEIATLPTIEFRLQFLSIITYFISEFKLLNEKDIYTYFLEVKKVVDRLKIVIKTYEKIFLYLMCKIKVKYDKTYDFMDELKKLITLNFSIENPICSYPKSLESLGKIYSKNDFNRNSKDTKNKIKGYKEPKSKENVNIYTSIFENNLSYLLKHSSCIDYEIMLEFNKTANNSAENILLNNIKVTINKNMQQCIVFEQCNYQIVFNMVTNEIETYDIFDGNIFVTNDKIGFTNILHYLPEEIDVKIEYSDKNNSYIRSIKCIDIKHSINTYYNAYYNKDSILTNVAVIDEIENDKTQIDEYCFKTQENDKSIIIKSKSEIRILNYLNCIDGKYSLLDTEKIGLHKVDEKYQPKSPIFEHITQSGNGKIMTYSGYSTEECITSTTNYKYDKFSNLQQRIKVDFDLGKEIYTKLFECDYDNAGRLQKLKLDKSSKIINFIYKNEKLEKIEYDNKDSVLLIKVISSDIELVSNLQLEYKNTIIKSYEYNRAKEVMTVNIKKLNEDVGELKIENTTKYVGKNGMLTKITNTKS